MEPNNYRRGIGRTTRLCRSVLTFWSGVLWLVHRPTPWRSQHQVHCFAVSRPLYVLCCSEHSPRRFHDPVRRIGSNTLLFNPSHCSIASPSCIRLLIGSSQVLLNLNKSDFRNCEVRSHANFCLRSDAFSFVLKIITMTAVILSFLVLSLSFSLLLVRPEPRFLLYTYYPFHECYLPHAFYSLV